MAATRKVSENPKPGQRKPTRKHHEEPRCKEITVSVSSGGSVGLVGFGNLKSDFKVFESRNYEIPEGWTEEQIDDFRTLKHADLRQNADTLAQLEFDSLIDQSALFDDDGTYIGSTK